MVVDIDPSTLDQVRELFKQLIHPITLHLFLTKAKRCLYCKEVEEVTDIIVRLSDKIRVKKYYEDSEEIKVFKIDLFPAIVVHGREEYNIRYFGLPVGYEFGVLVEDIIYVSKGTPDLPEEVLDEVKKIQESVHIKVFVTPTCPYCPYVARTAHMFALANRNIVADVIEAMEFPELADKYNVYAVPKVVINDRVSFEGVLSEDKFLEKVIEAL